MRISLELVPRTRATFLDEAVRVRASWPRIDTFNVPDGLRFELGSLAAAQALRRLPGLGFPHVVPHLRARDVDGAGAERLPDALATAEVDEVIVIAGDPRPDAPAGFSGHTPLELIRVLAVRAPHVTAYAALDPHRYAPDELARNLAEKRDAGAAGFFSQPLYDLHTLERCARLTGDVPVFWGLSPVVSVRSQRYWERVNQVRFPPEFEPTLSWSQRFGQRFMQEVAARGHRLYLMPIKVDVGTYLDGLSLAA